MSAETEAALERLRDAAEHGPGMMDSGQLHADLIDALAEIERLTLSQKAKEASTSDAWRQLSVSLEDAKQERTRANDLSTTVDALREHIGHMHFQSMYIETAARAAGYEEGQRAMRERAAHRMSCPCWVDFPGPGQGCQDPRGCFENAPDEIRALPILPEPQEGA